MALLSTFGILAGIGSLIVSTSAAIEARSDGINANLSSAQEHLNNARMLLVANRLFLSEEEYDESSVQSQVLSDELSRLKEQYLTYSRKPFFNSNRFKVLADTVKGLPSCTSNSSTSFITLDPIDPLILSPYPAPTPIPMPTPL
ncbi:hypothetical protein E4T56_gene20549 [Termitomyces sp. T112]|nr:hypothetical protein E4T56_gene20549 [Termitomyces sp. T112]